MTGGSTSDSLVYSNEINKLVAIAFDIEAVAGLPNLNMEEMVRFLLREQNESSLNISYGHLVPPGTTVLKVLHELDGILPRLPRDRATARELMLVSIPLTAIACIAVALRFISRKYITPKKLMSEDWWCLASLVAVVILEVGYDLGAGMGAGEHIWRLSLVEYRNNAKYVLGVILAFFPAHFVLKMAFLIFYKRLFGTQRSYRIAIYAIGAWVAALTFTGIFGCLFQCRIIDWWNHLSTKKCINTGMFMLIRSVLYSTTDFMLLILPVPGVLKLKISRREKIHVICLFGLGIFVSLASVFRLISLFHWWRSADFFYLNLTHSTWASVEVDLALICLCAPALKVLVFRKKTQSASVPSSIAKNWSRHGTYVRDKASGTNIHTQRNWQTSAAGARGEGGPLKGNMDVIEFSIIAPSRPQGVNDDSSEKCIVETVRQDEDECRFSP